MSPNSDLEHTQRSKTPRRALAQSYGLAMRKGEDSSRSAWKLALNAEERDDAKPNFGRVEEQQVESGSIQEVANDSISTVLWELVAGEVKQKV